MQSLLTAAYDELASGQRVHANPRQVLEDLTYEEAVWSPSEVPYSIAGLIHHCDYWNRYHLARVRGEPLPPRSDEWPRPGEPATREAWETLCRQWLYHRQQIRDLSAGNPGPERERAFVDIVCFLAHEAYHLGQMVLLRRCQGRWPAEGKVLA